MEVLIRRVGAPELNSLTKQYGETFSKMGVNIKDATSLYRMSENTLTPAENEARLHMAALQRSTVTPGSIKWAEDTAQTPELKGLVTRGAENLAQASAERESASLAATAVRNAMRGGSAIALGVGEVANVGMDYTLFSGTPHSLRTAAMDAAAAFVVLTPLAARWKLAAVVGTHIVNRIWDANSKDVGKI
jgi:hypothetical protein